jgi:hypothetical protein
MIFPPKKRHTSGMTIHEFFCQRWNVLACIYIYNIYVYIYRVHYFQLDTCVYKKYITIIIVASIISRYLPNLSSIKVDIYLSITCTYLYLIDTLYIYISRYMHYAHIYMYISGHPESSRSRYNIGHSIYFRIIIHLSIYIIYI